MRLSPKLFLRPVAVALACALPVASGIVPAAVQSGAAMAQTMLPAPYLSHALDALLLPVDDSVRATFGLAPEDMGVFVLATAPGGLGEAAGLQPGDVLDYVQGTEILSPADLDAIIWNWLQQGISDYTFDGKRAGAAIATTTVITVEYWLETVDVTTISTWSSYSSESFSYEEYTAEYSEEISASYEESSFEEEAYAEEGAVDDTATEEMATEDDSCMGEIIDGICQDGTEEAYDEAVEEDVVDEGGEDYGADDGGDEGGDAGGEEEIVE